MNIQELYVSAQGDREFREIADALEAATRYADQEVIIHIAPGTYRERLVVHQDNISMIGEDASTTRITYSDGAFEVLADGEKRGTFRTPSFFIDADHFYADNLTFCNEAGQGDIAGQALAVYARTAVSRDTRTLSLQRHFRKRRCSREAFVVLRNLLPGNMADIYTRTAISVET